MERRYASIWLPYLLTDWVALQRQDLRDQPLVLAAPDHGRMVVREVSHLAREQGIERGMVVADARAFVPGLEVLDMVPGLAEKLLKHLATWCIRFTPAAAVDPPDTLVLDITGCAHLWGGESAYLSVINQRLAAKGYQVESAIATTIGTAWALARFGKEARIAPPGSEATILAHLPPEALRIPVTHAARLYKLGIRYIADLFAMPRSVLVRRFGKEFMLRMDQALGIAAEMIQPVQLQPVYREDLPCPELILTRKGIDIALQRLVDALCVRMQQEQKGLRKAVFRAYRIDNNVQEVRIATNHPSHNPHHLVRLFESRIGNIEPAFGIELFSLEAQGVSPAPTQVLDFWGKEKGLADRAIAELLDRLALRVGTARIRRYLPQEHHWPERSFSSGVSLDELPLAAWRTNPLRPIQVLAVPEPVEVMAPIPDYPPMLFRYRGQRHKILRADGPERIEAEWWLEQGQHRDYYSVEDESGRRYWLFRAGHYTPGRGSQWFLHGFFP